MREEERRSRILNRVRRVQSGLAMCLYQILLTWCGHGFGEALKSGDVWWREKTSRRSRYLQQWSGCAARGGALACCVLACARAIRFLALSRSWGQFSTIPLRALVP